jgi:hypothetical protein
VSAHLTPDRRASLIERAKRAAVPVVNCVAASIPPAHILGSMTEAEKDALVIVLAEAVDHARLKAVTEAADDGLPAVTDDELRLRRAHAEAERLRVAGETVPNQLRCLDGEYHRQRREARVLAAADPEAEAHRQALAEALAERRTA